MILLGGANGIPNPSYYKSPTRWKDGERYPTKTCFPWDYASEMKATSVALVSFRAWKSSNTL